MQAEVLTAGAAGARDVKKREGFLWALSLVLDSSVCPRMENIELKNLIAASVHGMLGSADA